MTAGGKFNLCIKEFSESNNLKLRGETSSPDAAGSPVLDDKISYIQLTTMALWSTLAFCSSIQSKMIHFSKNMKRWTFNLFFFFFKWGLALCFLTGQTQRDQKVVIILTETLGDHFAAVQTAFTPHVMKKRALAIHERLAEVLRNVSTSVPTVLV